MKANSIAGAVACAGPVACAWTGNAHAIDATAQRPQTNLCIIVFPLCVQDTRAGGGFGVCAIAQKLRGGVDFPGYISD